VKYLTALTLALALAGAAGAIAPPVYPPPAIVPSDPSGPKPPPNGVPGGGPTPPPPINTPEPGTLTIAGISLAAASAYRLLRRGVRV
jgi:hypothetical protein